MPEVEVTEQEMHAIESWIIHNSRHYMLNIVGNRDKREKGVAHIADGEPIVFRPLFKDVANISGYGMSTSNEVLVKLRQAGVQRQGIIDAIEQAASRAKADLGI